MSKLLFRTLTLLLFCSSSTNGQEVIVFDTTSTHKLREAILILPGIADSKKNREIQKENFQHRGYDLFIPEYRDDNTLDQCVTNLDNFYNSNNLDSYDKVHVLSYIIGSWTLNQFILKFSKKNIYSVVYDRSPIQERAPCIVSNNLQFILWLKGIRFIIKDLAETDYPPIENDTIDIGIIIESKATKLMRIYDGKAKEMGEIQWEVEALNQDYDDYFYTRLDHDEMYSEVDEISDEIFYFFKKGSFSKEAKREPFNWDPFIPYKKEELE